MSGFSPLTYTQARQMLVEAYSAAASIPANDAPGSTLGAIWNALALMFVNEQNLVVNVQQIARLATSSGADVDSFVAPYGVERLPAVASSGQVTCSTSSAVAQKVVVPVGGMVQATNGLLFTVIADTTNAAYSAADNGYDINVGQSSVSVTVQCQTAGSIGNVQAGQITSVYGGGSAMPNVAVTNASAYTNGADEESDAQLKARFTLRESSGVVATGNALSAALLAVEAGLTYSIGDQLLLQIPTPTAGPWLSTTAGGALAARTCYAKFTYVGNGGETPASPESSISVPANDLLVANSPPAMAGASGWNFYAVDATSGAETKQNASPIAIGTNWTEPTSGMISGTAPPSSNTTGTNGTISAPGWVTIPVNVLGTNVGPSSTLLSSVQTAVNNQRSAGITCLVVAPTLVTVNVTATLSYTPSVVAGGTQNAVKQAVATAVQKYIDNIGLDPAGASTECPLFRVAAIILGVAGVANVDNVQLNGGTADISAGFAHQLVAGTVTLS